MLERGKDNPCRGGASYHSFIERRNQPVLQSHVPLPKLPYQDPLRAWRQKIVVRGFESLYRNDSIPSLGFRVQKFEFKRVESPNLASCLWLVKRKNTFDNGNSYFYLQQCWEVFLCLLYAFFRGCTQIVSK